MNKRNLYHGFYEAVKASYLKYLLHGDRSEEKLKPLHIWVGNTVRSFISKCKYNVYFLNGKEVQTEGAYYPKIVDVAITNKNTKVIEKRIGPKSIIYVPKIEMAISIKFITSNFKQNANNYFENLLGECANLRARRIKFGHFVVFRDKIPYFRRERQVKHWEILEDSYIEKYIKLFNNRNRKYLHTPDILGLEIVNFNPIVEERYNRKPPFDKKQINKVIKIISVQSGIQNTKLTNNQVKLILKTLNLWHFFNNIRQTLP